ncbi:MAG TPA: glycosyltransferase family 9 protein [Stellaceae bacterium]|nr:glycosyltransferase family 9 protein [Stellaceae bacterium]
MRLYLDRPQLIGDVALAAVGDTVVIDGRAEAEGGVARIDVYLDDDRLAVEVRDDDRSGTTAPPEAAPEAVMFVCRCPPERLRPGGHSVRIEVQAKTGRRIATTFFLKIYGAPLDEPPWRPRRKMPLAEIRSAERVLSGLNWRPAFALVVGIGETDAEIDAARRTLTSLRRQVYDRWRVVVLRRGRVLPDGCGERLLRGFDDIADRIDVLLDAPLPALLASVVNAARSGAAADLIGVLLAGDTLGCDALLETAVASGLHGEAELFYSDEYRISPVSDGYEAFLKPQWSPDLLLATNYIGRFWCALPGVFTRAAASVGEWAEFGDYDLVLRCTEATDGIRHIAKVLCQRGRPQLDLAEQESAALRRAIGRRAESGEVVSGRLAGFHRVKRTVAARPLVSIIIPTCAAGGHIKTCIETLRARTAYRKFEIVCIENIPSQADDWKGWLQQNADTVIAMREPFNWSRFNNLAAQQAAGDVLVFLNDDVEIVSEDWLDALLEQVQRPEIGVVGARLLYPDRTVQHAGIFWSPAGGRHAFRFAAEAAPGYFGLALTERNVLAVTGACLAMRRGEFAALGGFDERHSIVNNDVDCCLRTWERGRRVVYTPYAVLIHHELASRRGLGDRFDESGFAARWGRKLAAGDPFYHPLLSRDRDDYTCDFEPVELVYPGRPLLDDARLRNILAVKLDHIGDFITAIPALRRLRRRFPAARLYLLAAPWSAALRDLVPEVDEIIEFEFFHAESRLGERQLLSDDFSMLQQRLAPYDFDLAIDLRKATETRPLLPLTGAQWLAGYDSDGQFPWLDIALEWETDPRGGRKRSPISDDLVRLVDAIADAAQPDEPWAAPLAAPAAAPPRIAGASGRPRAARFICMHPGVGTPIRQWPAGYFAELIDRLVAAHDVEVALIGHASEAGLAAEILANLARPDRVRSLVGRLELAELAPLLAGAALFVGNNSGPHHLAARLGVPTVGIHSGTVDAREWGAVGPYAVAIRRNMVCSPCYFHDAALCGRGVACLTELRPADVFALCERLLAIGAPAAPAAGPLGSRAQSCYE